MMENPNSVNLRRHNSLPTTIRHSSSSKTHPLRWKNHIPAKSNPYVGWFRHAPPITSSKYFRKKVEDRMSLIDSSPYIGWFRNSKPYCCRVDTSLLVQSTSRLLAEYLEREMWVVPRRDGKTGLMRIEDLLCTGHLLGGTPRLSYGKDDRPSITTKLLRSIACWLFQDTDYDIVSGKLLQASLERQNDESSSSSSSDSSCEDDSSCASSSVESQASDDYSCPHNRRRSSSISSSSSSMMVSSQAEAYYAHTMLARSSQSPTGGGLGRLDYDITQMDIVRMTRNASRHLDVESILKLPTVTYQSPLKTTRIPPESEVQNKSRSASSDDKNSNDTKPQEWSWMLVQEGGMDVLDEHTSAASDTERHRNRPPLPEIRTNVAAEDKDVCVICLEHFVDGDRLRILPCNHSFHVGCIDQWLSGSHSFEDCDTAGCPTCKKRPYEDDLTAAAGGIFASGSVPSWAFARIGDALARQDSQISAFE